MSDRIRAEAKRIARRQPNKAKACAELREFIESLGLTPRERRRAKAPEQPPAAREIADEATRRFMESA